MVTYRKMIAIDSDLELIFDILTQESHIRSWESPISFLKEIHVGADKSRIIHWDIEYNADFIYTLAENIIGTRLQLEIRLHPDPLEYPDHKNVAEERNIEQSLQKIKLIAEHYQIN